LVRIVAEQCALAGKKVIIACTVANKVYITTTTTTTTATCLSVACIKLVQ
jgi:hypothetical protein